MIITDYKKLQKFSERLFNRVNMQVKICGITRADQAVAIATMGATALGFICVRRSPRYIEPAAIAQITAQLRSQLPSPVETVGVFADADVPTVSATVSEGGLSAVQLHGSESLQVCRQLRAQLPSIKLIKALRIRTPEDLQQARTYESVIDGLLLDAYHPQLLGGTGKTLDWQTLSSFRPDCPWLLAGGLTPDNVTAALGQLQPEGIDLSSGVEQAPGIKDLEKVQRLFRVLKQMPVSGQP